MNDVPLMVGYDHLGGKILRSITRRSPRTAHGRRSLLALGYLYLHRYDNVDGHAVNGELVLRTPLEASSDSFFENKSHKRRLGRSGCQVLRGTATLRGRMSVLERFDGLVNPESEALELT
jgi:hypothetical protein